MKNYQKIGVYVLFFSTTLPLSAQTAHTLSREADAAYRQQDYQKAEEQYRKAQQKGGGVKTEFNAGNAVFMQKRYAEAEKIYAETAQKTQQTDLKAHALFNKGNAQFWQKNYASAVESYKQALRLQPHDVETKQNLALAQRYLKKQQEEEAKQKAANATPDKSPKTPESEKKTPQNPQADIAADAQNNKARNNAQEMLRIMDEEERKVQARLKKDKGQARPNKSGKDW